jgi:hypothetical protein
MTGSLLNPDGAADDLSDLGPEQPLPDPTARALRPDPCQCENPWPNGEGGCMRCGRAAA